MKILVYLTFRESQDHYIMITNKPKLYKQTKTLPVITIRQFSNQCDRCKMLKVVHGNQSDNHCNWSDTQPSLPLLCIYYTALQQYQKTPKVLPSLPNMHTHNTHSLVVLHFKTVTFVFENHAVKQNHNRQSDQLPIFCQYNINADFNQCNTRN